MIHQFFSYPWDIISTTCNFKASGLFCLIFSRVSVHSWLQGSKCIVGGHYRWTQQEDVAEESCCTYGNQKAKTKGRTRDKNAHFQVIHLSDPLLITWHISGNLLDLNPIRWLFSSMWLVMGRFSNRKSTQKQNTKTVQSLSRLQIISWNT